MAALRGRRDRTGGDEVSLCWAQEKTKMWNHWGERTWVWGVAMVSRSHRAFQWGDNVSDCRITTETSIWSRKTGTFKAVWVLIHSVHFLPSVMSTNPSRPNTFTIHICLFFFHCFEWLPSLFAVLCSPSSGFLFPSPTSLLILLYITKESESAKIPVPADLFYVTSPDFSQKYISQKEQLPLYAKHSALMEAKGTQQGCLPLTVRLCLHWKLGTHAQARSYSPSAQAVPLPLRHSVYQKYSSPDYHSKVMSIFLPRIIYPHVLY